MGTTKQGTEAKSVRKHAGSSSGRPSAETVPCRGIGGLIGATESGETVSWLLTRARVSPKSLGLRDEGQPEVLSGRTVRNRRWLVLNRW